MTMESPLPKLPKKFKIFKIPIMQFFKCRITKDIKS